MPVLSKSQLETYITCPHKWGVTYLKGIRPPPNRSAKAGLVVHAMLEKWRLDGTVPEKERVDVIAGHEYKVGEIAHMMMRHLPPNPVEGIQAENRDEFKINGIDYVAIRDWVAPGILGDYKTTSDFKWALKEETLPLDIQAVLSARHMDEDLLLWWTYGRTNAKPQGRAVKVRVTKEQIRTNYLDIVLPLSEVVLAAYEKNDPLSLTKEFDSCSKYGGCPFRDTEHCQITNGQRLRAIMSKESMLEKLRRKAAALATPESEPVDQINPPKTEAQEPAPSPAPSPAPIVGGMNSVAAVAAYETKIMALKAELDEAQRSVGRDSTESVTPPTSKPIKTLFVDCLPLGRTTNLVYAHDLMAAAAQEVCDDVQLPHVKLADFAKGGPMLAAQLAHNIKQMTGPIDVVLISRTPEGRDVQQTLLGMAEYVVLAL